MLALFFCPFGPTQELTPVFIYPVTRKDHTLPITWREFDQTHPIPSAHGSERTGFLPWEVAIRNIGLYNGDIFKVISLVKGTERLEGLIHLEFTENNEVHIEALEAAPWNRELYLGDNREFHKMGLILFAKAILYGIEHKFCGTIRLESLEVREDYYRDGLQMTDNFNGNFSYSKMETRDLLKYLIHERFLLLRR